MKQFLTLMLSALLLLSPFASLAEAKTTPEVASTASPAASVSPTATAEESAAPRTIKAPEFTLVDQNGKSHSLADYKGKVIFLNFWATWCPPCRGEMPEIQKLYEKHGSNQEELVVLGVASPKIGQEGDADHIKDFLTKNKYSFPVLMDEGGSMLSLYQISAFPTTFMIDVNGNVFGYVPGGLSYEIMEDIVKQTREGVTAEK